MLQPLALLCRAQRYISMAPFRQQHKRSIGPQPGMRRLGLSKDQEVGRVHSDESVAQHSRVVLAPARNEGRQGRKRSRRHSWPEATCMPARRGLQRSGGTAPRTHRRMSVRNRNIISEIDGDAVFHPVAIARRAEVLVIAALPGRRRGIVGPVSGLLEPFGAGGCAFRHAANMMPLAALCKWG